MPSYPPKTLDAEAPIDLSLFAHIVNGTHISGGYQLEGNVFQRTITYLLKYLEQTQQNFNIDFEPFKIRMQQLKQSADRLNNIKNATELKTLATELTNELLQKIDKNSNETIALPGGWRGFSGHAMAYLFKITEDGFDFSIYNAGSGLLNHARYSQHEREMYLPIMTYHLKKPFDANKLQDFIYHILRPTFVILEGSKPIYADANYLYNQVFARLYDLNKSKRATLKPLEDMPEHLRTGGQLSGNCAEAVLHQFLKEACPNAIIYKRLMYEFKRHALNDLLQQPDYQDSDHPAIKNQVTHALRTLSRMLTEDQVFDEAYITKEQAYLQKYWEKLEKFQALTQTSDSLDDSPVINPMQQTILLKSHPPIQQAISQAINNGTHLFKLPARRTNGHNLLQNLQQLLQEYIALNTNKQHIDVMVELEHLFVSMPLPEKNQPFDTPLAFYQDITLENRGEFYHVMHELQTLYIDACRQSVPTGSMESSPRYLVTQLSITSVLDYVQNRLSPWESMNARLFGGTLHNEVTRRIHHLLQNNDRNPWLATHHPIFDNRLYTIRKLYQKEEFRWIDPVITMTTMGYTLILMITVYLLFIGTYISCLIFMLSLRGLPEFLAFLLSEVFIISIPFGVALLFGELIAHYLSYIIPYDTDPVTLRVAFKDRALEYYQRIINLHPEAKKELEDYYQNELRSQSNTVISDKEDYTLNLQQCKALRALSCYRDKKVNFKSIRLPEVEKLIQTIKAQEALEKSMFNETLLDDRYTRTKIWYEFGRIYSPATPVERVTRNDTSLPDKRPYLSDSLMTYQYVCTNKSTLATEEALKKDFRAKIQEQDNTIQLLHLKAPLLTNRQYYHLRQAPLLQIRETLHYFYQNLDKLNSKSAQTYLEANLFQPMLLLNELASSEKDTDKQDILNEIEQFVDDGIVYYAQRSLCTKPSLFFIRLAYLACDYGAKSNQNKNHLTRLLDKIEVLLKANQDAPNEIKSGLYLYQFLTEMSYLHIDQDALHIKRALHALFFMNIYQAQILDLDQSSASELMRQQTYLKHAIDRLSPQDLTDTVQTLIQNTLTTQMLTCQHIQNFMYHVTTPKGQYHVDLVNGLLFNSQGVALIATPLDVGSAILSKDPSLSLPKLCCINTTTAQNKLNKGPRITTQLYELGTPNVNMRYEKIADQLEKTWEINGENRWYRFQNKSDIIDLPDIFQQVDYRVWLDTQTSSLIITFNNQPRYRYDRQTNRYHQLTSNAYDNGLMLCKPDTWIHALFAPMELTEYIHVWVSEELEHQTSYQVNLPRYGLTLVAHQDTTEAKPVQFYMQSEPNLRLIRDESTHKNLSLAHLPNFPVMTFEDVNTLQRYCYIPYQQFVENDDAISPHCEFYHLKLNQQGMPVPNDWKGEQTEKLICITLDANGHPNPKTVHDALYLAYIYLGNHKPELAWQMLEDIAKHKNGLQVQATAEEIQVLHWLCGSLPMNNSDANPDTPVYVACRLKALALFTSTLSPSSSILFSEKFAPTENFYNKLYKTIQTLYQRYQSMYRDTIHHFSLNEEEQRSLLNFECRPHIGSMGVKQKTLNLLQRAQEKNRLLQAQQQSALPKSYTKRLQELDTLLNKTHTVKSHHSRIIWVIVNFYMPINLILSMFHDFYDTHCVVWDPSLEDKFDEAMQFLSGEDPLDYILTNPAICLRIMLMSDRADLRQKITDISRLYMLQHPAFNPLTSTENAKLWYLCNVYVRLGYWLNPIAYPVSMLLSFLETIALIIQKNLSMNIHIPISLITTYAFMLIPPLMMIQTYQDDPHESLSVDLNLAKNAPVPSNKMTATAPDLLQSFTFENLIEHNTEDSEWDNTRTKWLDWAQEYKQQAAIFGQPSTTSQDKAMLGDEQYQAWQRMKSIAGAWLNQKKHRDYLQEKATSQAQALQIKQEKYLQEALTLANSGFASNEKETLHKQLATTIKARAPLTEKELFALFEAQDKARYAKETGLSSEQIQTLHQLLTNHIAITTLQNKLTRFIDKVNLLQDDSSVTDMQQALQELLAEDKVDYTHEALFALFQYKENKLLRPQQKDTLSHLLKHSQDGFGYENVVEKLIMGGGKSKVILPLLAKAKATGTNLVVIEVPRPLLKTNYADLLNTSENLLGLQPYLFDFKRETSCTPANLAHLNQKLNDVMVNQRYVITTGDAVQSLELKYLELLLQPPVYKTYSFKNGFEKPEKMSENVIYLSENSRQYFIKGMTKPEFIPPHIDIDKLEEKLSDRQFTDTLLYTLSNNGQALDDVRVQKQQIIELDQLIQLFRTRADAVIDEIHAGFLLKQELNYTLNDGETPAPWLIQKTVELYDFIAESQPKIISQKECLTTDQALSDAMQRLVDALLDTLNSPLKDALKAMEPITEEKLNLMRHYLLNQSPEIPKDIIEQEDTHRKVWALYKEQIGHLLPMTLRRNLNEHYGASHQDPNLNIAIPYLANNQPNERSRFANHLEAMNYTIQMTMLQGAPEDLLRQYILELQDKANIELLISPDLKTIDKTPIGQLFHQMVPDQQLSDIQAEDPDTFSHVADSMRHNAWLISQLLKEMILPKLQIDTAILHSNSCAHMSLYRSCQGLTGTPDFHTTWPMGLDFNENNFAATNEFIMQVLEKKLTKSRSVAYNLPLKERLRSLLDNQTNVRAIIDICAVFKGTPNQDVAYELADYLRQAQPTLQYVVFFNQQNQLCALNIREGSQPIILNASEPDKINAILKCGPESRFTYYDQAHTVGTDLTQELKAKALALIDHNTQLQACLQGVMRMRGLADEQSVELIVPSGLNDSTFDELVEMMRKNQEKQLLKDNFYATKARMRNVIREHLMKQILNCQDIHQKKEIAQTYKKLFVNYMPKDEEFFKYHGEVITMRAAKDLLEEHKEALIQIDKHQFMQFEQTFNDMITQALPLCATQYPYRHTYSQDGIEVETQKQTQVQRENEIEKELELIDRLLLPFPHLSWWIPPSWYYYSSLFGFHSLNHIISGNHEQSLNFGNIYVTSNYQQVYFLQQKYVGHYLKPVHALLFRQSASGHLDCVILSQQEANELASGMQTNPEPNVWMATTDMTVLAGAPPKDIKENTAYQCLIEQACFFAGDFKPLLSGTIPLRWLHENSAQKIEYFRKELQPYRETRRRDTAALEFLLSEHANTERPTQCISKSGFFAKSWSPEKSILSQFYDLLPALF